MTIKLLESWLIGLVIGGLTMWSFEARQIRYLKIKNIELIGEIVMCERKDSNP